MPTAILTTKPMMVNDMAVRNFSARLGKNFSVWYEEFVKIIRCNK